MIIVLRKMQFLALAIALVLSVLRADGAIVLPGAGAATSFNGLTNGQLLIGSTGVAAAKATLTATRDVVVTNGAGTITLDTRRVGSGRLTFSSATLIQFCPFNGNQIFIPSTGKAYAIPSACTTAANTSVFVAGTGSSNLAASTTYWAYLFDSGGTLTFDFYTASTHTADTTTGIEIRTADTSRVLIGMVRTNGSSQFEDDNSLRGVLSYFNRRAIGLANGFTVNRTTVSASYAEVNTEIRGNFVTWADEAVVIGISGAVKNDSLAATVSTSLGIDGTTAEDTDNQFNTPVISDLVPIGLTLVKNGLTEGFHFATLLGAAGAGTDTYTGNATAGSRTALTVEIRG